MPLPRFLLSSPKILADIGLVQGMAMDEHLELLFVMTEGLLDATKQNARVATGRRSDPAGGYQGYVVWQRQGTPNRTCATASLGHPKRSHRHCT